MNLSFSKSTVLVTGVGGAIGLAVANKLREAGAKVIGVDLLPPKQIKQNNLPYIEIYQSNLSIESDVKEFLKLINSEAVTDVVCCAGIAGEVTDAEKIDIENFEKCLSSSLTSSMLMVKNFTPIFKRKNKGNFILFSSVAGARGNALMPAYTAAKHGVIGLTRAYARELGPHGIRVNCVLPGLINSKMALGIYNELESRFSGFQEVKSIPQSSASAIPLRRLGQPEDVANVVLFLLSELSSYCHGGLFAVDGGLLVK